MEIKAILDKIDHGKIYVRNGVECTLDPFRKKLVCLTSEEIIRQKLALFLMEFLQVPKECIFTEKPISHFGSNKRGRMDIVIVEYIDDSIKPIAVIECKSENIELSDQTFNQVTKYADAIIAEYVFVCNGIEILSWHYNDKEKLYERVSDIPSYTDMINKQFNLLEEEFVEYQRLQLNDLNEEELLEEKGILDLIGLDTANTLIPSISNLIECIFDTTHTMPSCESKTFSVVDDLGIKFLNYGDASGGSFGTGYYRTLLIRNKTGSHQLVNITIMATGKTNNHPKYGNSTGKTVLIISLDDFDKDYMVVQINLNKFIKLEGNYLSLYHNGVVNMKNARRVDLLSLIQAANKDLLHNDLIVLGKIEPNYLFYMDSPSVVDMILNIIEYTLIRDDYKKEISSLNKSKSI